VRGGSRTWEVHREQLAWAKKKKRKGKKRNKKSNSQVWVSKKRTGVRMKGRKKSLARFMGGGWGTVFNQRQMPGNPKKREIKGPGGGDGRDASKLSKDTPALAFKRTCINVHSNWGAPEHVVF